MRKVAVVALASMFLAAPSVVLAETANTNPPTEQQYNGNYHCGYGYGMHGDRDYRGHRGHMMNNSGHMMDRGYAESRMFNGITLTEQQRTQMRDLMRQHHQDRYNGNYRQRHENMHKLVTAPQFDEAAVRAQMQDMDKQAIERHVEMAKVHNQMYQLLTPEQKAQLEKNYQQQMSDFDARN